LAWSARYPANSVSDRATYPSHLRLNFLRKKGEWPTAIPRCDLAAAATTLGSGDLSSYYSGQLHRSDYGHALTPRQSNTEIGRLFRLVAWVVALGTVYFAQGFLIPLALALLLSLVLSPLVRQLEKLRFRRVPAVLLVVCVTMSLAIWLGVAVTNQLLDVTGDLPTYRANIQDKLKTVHDGGNAHVMRAVQAVADVAAEIVGTIPNPSRPEFPRNTRVSVESKAQEPLPVRVVPAPVNSLESVLSFLAPIGSALVVLVFTIFILLRTNDIRHRFIRLVGHNHISAMSKALDDASQRIGRYLLFQFAVNLCYGMAIAGVLRIIGLPNALLWGAIAGVLRFLPYIGPPAGGSLPILFSLAYFDGWTRSLIILGFLIVLEIAVANFIEPLLYGAKTGISSLAILVAAVFWTLLWGPIGLLLSTPLTVCLVVLGQYVPQLEFLHVILGHEAEITPATHFYQRMMAFDLDASRQVLIENLRSASLLELYDSTVVPALALIQRDRQQNDLEDKPADFVVQNARELIEELNENYAEPQQASDGRQVEVNAESAKRIGSVICVPARNSTDETVGVMLAQLLEREGKPAFCIPLDSQAQMIQQVTDEGPDVVIVSALQPFGLIHARRLADQIQQQISRANIVIGLWNFTDETASLSARFGVGKKISIVTSLAQAVEKIAALPVERPTQPDSKVLASR
jgi:predicted PurR-regulated permease PerM